MLAPSPHSLAQGGEGGKECVLLVMLQKGCRRKSNFSLDPKRGRGIKIFINVGVLRPEWKESYIMSRKEVFAPMVQNGIKTVQNCDKFFTIST